MFPSPTQDSVPASPAAQESMDVDMRGDDDDDDDDDDEQM